MNTNYADIVSKAGLPFWWDELGVPRYVPFHPTECGVYHNHVALMDVRCQVCHRIFWVAVGRHERNWRGAGGPGEVPRFELPRTRYARGDAFDPSDDPNECVGSFDYGDPPRGDATHDDCHGETMTTEPVAVVEFWRRGEDGSWARVPEHEGPFLGLVP